MFDNGDRTFLLSLSPSIGCLTSRVLIIICVPNELKIATNDDDADDLRIMPQTNCFDQSINDDRSTIDELSSNDDEDELEALLFLVDNDEYVASMWGNASSSSLSRVVVFVFVFRSCPPSIDGHQE